MALKPEERDELLTRLDERTQNIWRSINEILEQQKTQNSGIRTALERTISNRVWIRTITAIGSSVISLTVGIMITKAINLW